MSYTFGLAEKKKQRVDTYVCLPRITPVYNVVCKICMWNLVYMIVVYQVSMYLLHNMHCIEQVWPRRAARGRGTAALPHILR